MARKLGLAFFAILLGLYALAPRFPNMNAASRFYLTRAIVEEGRLEIDHYLNLDLNMDWSAHDAHYYTNKAPGASFAGVPVYFIFYKIENLFHIDLENWSYRNLRWTDVIVTAVPSVLLSILILSYLLARAVNTTERSWAWIVCATYATATGAFSYSTMLWGHQTASFFLFAAFYCATIRKMPAAVGSFLGLAVLTEYNCALAIPGFAVYALLDPVYQKNRFRSILLALSGALPWAILFAWYHKVCFGGFFSMAPQFQNPAFAGTYPAKYLGSFNAPSFTILFQLLFGFARGLFIISPVLLFAVSGFYTWIRGKRAVEAWLSLWIIGVYLLLTMSYPAWQGGGSSGPRYLVPILPYFALALCRVQSKTLFYLTLGASVLNICAIQATDMLVGTGTPNLLKYIYSTMAAQNKFLWPFLPLLLTVLMLFALARTASTAR